MLWVINLGFKPLFDSLFDVSDIRFVVSAIYSDFLVVSGNFEILFVDSVVVQYFLVFLF